jgi:hypothetical protein
MTDADTIDYSSIKADDPRLWNISQLASILGVHRAYVSRMRSKGFKMPFGKATVAMAHEFLNKNADAMDGVKIRSQAADQG